MTSDPLLPSLDLSLPHLIEAILTLAIRSVPRPILFASAGTIATYLNVASRNDTGLSPSHAAIHRLPWIDSTVAARIGNPWLLRQLALLASRASYSRSHRPIQCDPQSIALSVGKRGDLAFIQLVIQIDPALVDGCLHHVIQQASIHGHVHVLDWIAGISPYTYQSTSTTDHLVHAPPGDTSGNQHIRVLQWWMAHEHLWHPHWLVNWPTWQLPVLVHACKQQRTKVIEYWVAACTKWSQNHSLPPFDTPHVPRYTSWPLAAAAFTGNMDFFNTMVDQWPSAMDHHVLALACASGNLSLARRCYALLVPAGSSAGGAGDHGGALYQKDMDLCYLLVSASPAFNPNASSASQDAVSVLEWLHSDLKFPVTGHAGVLGLSQHLVPITGTWPISWEGVPEFFMDVATAAGSTAVLDWWRARLRDKTEDEDARCFRIPLHATLCARGTDPVVLLQWWKDACLLPDFQDDVVARDGWGKLTGTTLIETRSSVQVFDWFLHFLHADTPHHFPPLMVDRACQAGRLDLLDWIMGNADKLPKPLYSPNALDVAYRNGHLNALQWFADRGLLDAVRARDRDEGQGKVERPLQVTQPPSFLGSVFTGLLDFVRGRSVSDSGEHVSERVPRAPLERTAISFVARKWPECFECFEWAVSNGFTLGSDKAYARAVELSLPSPLYGDMLAQLRLRACSED